MPILETQRSGVEPLIAVNSLALTGQTFLKSSGTGFVNVATASTDRIIGVNETFATFAADNQTNAKKVVNYVPKTEMRVYEVAISAGAVTKADEGKFFSLSALDTVGGATVSTVPFYVNTSDAGVAVDAVISMQLELVEFISATKGRFRIINL